VKRLLCWAFLGMAVLGCGSAGPYAYVYMTTIKATRAVATAKAGNAEKMAPYEYWAAVTYLQMSREKATSADYELAYDYGKKARDMARKANKIAVSKGEEGPNARAALQAPPQVVTESAPAKAPAKKKAPAPKVSPPATKKAPAADTKPSEGVKP